MSQTPAQRLLVRAALAIQGQYAAHASRPVLIELPHAAWHECVRATQLLESARRRRWSAAADELTYRVRRACSVLAHEFGRLDELLKPRTTPRVPALRDVYSELVALYGEYDQIRIDRRAEMLIVRTEPIELEGIDLGPFEIQLRWTALPDPRCYSVVALQPHPSGADGYVHPHVLSELLCEGDGRLPIQRALADGRLCDFFQIVVRVLESYNAESAYTAMEDWDGVNCSGCGDSISDDDASHCSRCGAIMCFDCYERCSRCDEAYCSECVLPCAICEDVCCRGCLNTCPECQGDTCDNCRTHAQRCRNCSPEETCEESAAAVDTAGPAGAGEAAANPAASAPKADAVDRAAVALYAHGVGQTRVPA